MRVSDVLTVKLTGTTSGLFAAADENEIVPVYVPGTRPEGSIVGVTESGVMPPLEICSHGPPVSVEAEAWKVSALPLLVT